jgi:hypothetical protein
MDCWFPSATSNNFNSSLGGVTPIKIATFTPPTLPLNCASEKSSDAKAFIEVGRVAAKGAPETLTAYALVDKNPVLGVAYYRLKPSNKPLTSMTISMIGYKYTGSGKDMKLSDIAPGESSR